MVGASISVQPAAAGKGDVPQRTTVTLERLEAPHKGEIEKIKARYLIGCDGARSIVRTSIGRELHGNSANHAWGVMDVLAVTDFPDIRCKSFIQSANDGTIIIIPREGGYLFRLYVELDRTRCRRAGREPQYYARPADCQSAANFQSVQARR